MRYSRMKNATATADVTQVIVRVRSCVAYIHDILLAFYDVDGRTRVFHTAISLTVLTLSNSFFHDYMFSTMGITIR